MSNGPQQFSSSYASAERLRRLLSLAQDYADRYEVFRTRGPGEGNKVTNLAIDALSKQVQEEFGAGVIQQVLSNENAQSVDFFLESERIVVEIEFSLSNPYPTLEKDLIKVLVAKDSGKAIDRLVLVGDPGSLQKHARPAQRSVIAWAKRHHNLEIETVELRLKNSQETP